MQFLIKTARFAPHIHTALKVYRALSEFNLIPFPVVTTGTFDGVHLGHQTILKRLTELARANQGESVVITFHPHPRLVLQPENHSLELLTTLEEKLELLEKAGIDHVLVVPFDIEFARLSSEQFIRQILVDTVHTKKLVIGYDHHFGKNREGSFEHLSKYGPEYGFDVEEIPAKDIDAVAVSSTRIRNALHAGDLQTANEYLGYAYGFKGLVVHGKQLGGTIGFPTANIDVSGKRKLIPGNGVYAVTVYHQGTSYLGMMNIGNRPTVSDSLDRHLEVHILDFNASIYNEELQVKLHTRIRNEIKFPNVQSLVQQLNHDRAQAIELLKDKP